VRVLLTKFLGNDRIKHRGTNVIKKIKNILKKSFVLRLFVIKRRVRYYSRLSKASEEELIKREILKYENHYSVTPNLNSPKKLSEKLLWQKLYYKNSELSHYADKYFVKEKSKQLLGVDLGVKTLKVFTTPDELTINSLPNKFVLKINNGTGYIYLGTKTKNGIAFKDLKDKDGPSYSLKHIKKIFHLLFQLNHFYASYEYSYKEITPLLMAEEFLEEKNLTDYKFHMNYGKFVFLNVVTGRPFNTRDDYYDENLNRMDIIWDNPPSDNAEPLPEEIEQMKKYASLLSEDFPISRIDFYIANKRIYLGEVTFYQNAGYFNIEYPNDLDLTLGTKFDISKDFNKSKIILYDKLNATD
jgi:hypothetical protein